MLRVRQSREHLLAPAGERVRDVDRRVRIGSRGAHAPGPILNLVALAHHVRASDEIPRRKTVRLAARAHALVAPVGGRRVSQYSSGAAGIAGRRRRASVAVGISVRRRATRSAARHCRSQDPRDVWAEGSRQRLARDVAWSFDRPDRNRRLSRADGSGLGSARFALAAGGPEAIPAGARARCAHCRRSTS